jgi:hypothetical protein
MKKLILKLTSETNKKVFLLKTVTEIVEIVTLIDQKTQKTMLKILILVDFCFFPIEMFASLE